MKLHLTATSERGKPVTKSGNEHVKIDIQDDTRDIIGKVGISHKGEKIQFEIVMFNPYKRIVHYYHTEPKTARECEVCGENDEIRNTTGICQNIPR